MGSTIPDPGRASISWLEHQMLEHIKSALRITVDWKAPEVSGEKRRSSVAFAMKSFQRHLERLMAIEEEGGYMYIVADAKPNKQRQIRQLQEDHDVFRRRVDELVPLVEGLEDWQEDQFDSACIEIKQLLDEVDRHDRAEVKLLQETLLLDEGGEG